MGCSPSADGDGDVVVFAAGSGITPIISIVKTGLATSPDGSAAVRQPRPVRHDLRGRAARDRRTGSPSDLKSSYHLDVDHGFVDPGTIRPFVGGRPPPSFDLCGPTPFMDIVSEPARPGHGPGPDPRRAVRRPRRREPERRPTMRRDRITIELDGRTESRYHPGTTLLQTARQLGLWPPSCEAGSCATCIAKVVEGSVTMWVNDASTDDEVADVGADLYGRARPPVGAGRLRGG